VELCTIVASRMAAASWTQSEAARVMSVKTMATSPSGGRTAVGAVTAARCAEPREPDDDDEPPSFSANDSAALL
jgi:hypothetical protein